MFRDVYQRTESTLVKTLQYSIQGKRFQDIKERDAEKRNDFKERGTEDFKK
jgi:hypothetical protein